MGHPPVDDHTTNHCLGRHAGAILTVSYPRKDNPYMTRAHIMQPTP